MIGSASGTFWAVLAALFAFGAIYNWLVGWLERRGYDEGYTALLVVGGVAVSLIGLAVLDWQGAMLGLTCFAASGFWMVIGSIRRYVRRRRAGQEAQRREIRS